MKLYHWLVVVWSVFIPHFKSFVVTEGRGIFFMHSRAWLIDRILPTFYQPSFNLESGETHNQSVHIMLNNCILI